jgi:hypothetical protein
MNEEKSTLLLQSAYASLVFATVSNLRRASATVNSAVEDWSDLDRSIMETREKSKAGGLHGHTGTSAREIISQTIRCPLPRPRNGIKLS